MRYSALTAFKQRRLFDPSSKKDTQELKYFLENDRWEDGCPFYIEYPWEDVPAMCKDKYAFYALKCTK